jgi:hypothetical protein
MKKTLGSLFIFFSLYLSASDLCDYSFKVSNYSPYVNESVEIIFEAVQKDKNSVMFFELKPKENKDYQLYLIEKSDMKKSYHDNKVRYRYIMYALKSGEIALDFDFKVQEASDEAVEKFYTGNRDVLNPMATKDTVIELKPLVFNVKALEKKVDFIGDFELGFDIDKKEIKAYEQLNLTYKLKGKGKAYIKKDILPKIAGVDKFLEFSGDIKSFIKGGEIVYRYALLSDKDFTIPEVNIECFSPKKHKYYTLKVPPENIKVSSIEVKNLLDEKDSYPVTAFDWDKLLPYLNGLLLFLAGFAVAKLDLLKYLKKTEPQLNPINTKIKKAKDEKELLKVLLSSYKNCYNQYIKQLEESIYEQKRCDFPKLKDELLKL